ncbi:MAG: YggU family protein [Candidatus Altiarchaeota archaeon]|nr:YggU family protein [Candidatus Altiarchaeota archaeon]
MLECIRSSRAGTSIDILVIPESRKEGLEYDKTRKRLKIRIAEPAVKGKANKAALKKFNNLLGECVIVSGRLSRKKTILVKGKSIEEVAQILEKGGFY